MVGDLEIFQFIVNLKIKLKFDEKFEISSF